MTKIYLDCTGIRQPEELHRALCEALAFPDWYGYNLDALYDALTETSAQLILENWQTLAAWREGFGLAFADAAQDNPEFSYELE